MRIFRVYKAGQGNRDLIFTDEEAAELAAILEFLRGHRPLDTGDISVRGIYIRGERKNTPG